MQLPRRTHEESYSMSEPTVPPDAVVAALQAALEADRRAAWPEGTCLYLPSSRVFLLSGIVRLAEDMPDAK